MTGFSFGPVFFHQKVFFVNRDLVDRMADSKGLSLKIDGIPFQPYDFTPAQTIEGCKNDAEFDGSPFTVSKRFSSSSWL